MATTKKIAYKIYEITAHGRTFQIDGQNHEHDSREWQLFEVVAGPCCDENEWIETYPTKGDAVADVLANFNRG